MIKNAFLLFRHSIIFKALVAYSICSTLALLFIPYRTAFPALSCPYKWAGGSPIGTPVGSCWCGWDSYCMCTPSLAIDIVLEKRDDLGQVTDIALVNRLDGGGLATCGGFVSVGEKVEDAMIREVYEETGLEVTDYKYWKVYSDPSQDPRRHTVSVTYVGTYAGTPRGGDDAKEVVVIPVDKLKDMVLAKLKDMVSHRLADSDSRGSSSSSSSSSGDSTLNLRTREGVDIAPRDGQGSAPANSGTSYHFAFDHALILYEYFETFHH